MLYTEKQVHIFVYFTFNSKIGYSNHFRSKAGIRMGFHGVDRVIRWDAEAWGLN